jgi:hypothetical protein
VIRDGLYKVYFQSTNEYDEPYKEEAGEYVIKKGKIIHTSGLCSSLLEYGPIDVKAMHVMKNSFNNGYYFTSKIN